MKFKVWKWKVESNKTKSLGFYIMPSPFGTKKEQYSYPVITIGLLLFTIYINL